MSRNVGVSKDTSCLLDDEMLGEGYSKPWPHNICWCPTYLQVLNVSGRRSPLLSTFSSHNGSYPIILRTWRNRGLIVIWYDRLACPSAYTVSLHELHATQMGAPFLFSDNEPFTIRSPGTKPEIRTALWKKKGNLPATGLLELYQKQEPVEEITL